MKIFDFKNKKLVILSIDKGDFLHGDRDKDEVNFFTKIFSLGNIHFYWKKLVARKGDVIELEHESGNVIKFRLVNVNLLGLRLEGGDCEFFYNHGILKRIR